VCLQVKYKEEYEKNRGKSQMEFVDTQMYKVSKEAQRMQSEVCVCVCVCERERVHACVRACVCVCV